MPSMIVTAIASTNPQRIPATLPTGEEDTLKFSFEATYVAGEASYDGTP